MRHDVARLALKFARDHVAGVAAKVDSAPSKAKIAAGNYAKGHMVLHGLPITIETPKGGKRSGVGPDGKPWSATMPSHYGYLKRTKGADDDHVDCYIGPHPLSQSAWVVDQRDAKSKRFDEHKVMLGFSSPEAAQAAYTAAFSDGQGEARIGGITKMSIGQLKRWLTRGDTTAPLT